jgi:hypothetical protein
MRFKRGGILTTRTSHSRPRSPPLSLILTPSLSISSRTESSCGSGPPAPNEMSSPLVVTSSVWYAPSAMRCTGSPARFSAVGSSRSSRVPAASPPAAKCSHIRSQSQITVGRAASHMALRLARSAERFCLITHSRYDCESHLTRRHASWPCVPPHTHCVDAIWCRPRTRRVSAF